MKALFWILLAIGGIWAIFTISGGSGGSDAPHSQTGCSASRRAIEVRLKAPSSAKWIDCNSTTEAGLQTVVLTVDSQNAFGAMIRSQWVTKVRNNNVESVTQMR